MDAFTREFTSLTNGLVLVLTLLFWNVLLEALAYRFPALRKILKPARCPLIETSS